MSKIRVKENKSDNKDRACDIVDKAAESARMRACTSIFGQNSLYSKKAKDAKEYKESGKTSELLEIDSRVYGITLDQAASNIIEKSRLLENKICLIEEKRLSSKRDIEDNKSNVFDIAKSAKKEIDDVE